jgi:hypothetical protein
MVQCIYDIDILHLWVALLNTPHTINKNTNKNTTNKNKNNTTNNNTTNSNIINKINIISEFINRKFEDLFVYLFEKLGILAIAVYRWLHIYLSLSICHTIITDYLSNYRKSSYDALPYVFIPSRYRSMYLCNYVSINIRLYP